MKTVLITGYSGFVGSNLAPHLSVRGFDVIGIGRKRYTKFFFEQHNYEELSHIKDYNAIIHLAAKAHDIKHNVIEAEYVEANTELTIRVFEEFLTSKATDFIYLSSVKAVADSVDGVLFETVQPKPLTAYGRSKLKAEQYLLNAKLPEGKRLFILRPCMIHGPSNKGNLNVLYKFLKKGIPYPLAAFKNKRSLLSVQNLVFVIETLLMNGEIAGGVYNVADDDSLSTNEIIDILGDAKGLKPVKWHISKTLVKKLARAGGVFNQALGAQVQKLTENYEVSNDKIKQATGIKSFPVTSREGLYYTAKHL